MCQAALAFARRGWPVFPCNEKNGRPLVGGDRDAAGKVIPNSGGLHKATCDEAQIVTWWSKWPRAQIGLHSGAGGLLHLDFDPRVDRSVTETVDEQTGEVGELVEEKVWTVDLLKAALFVQMGAPLPDTLTSLTPSGGEHKWFLMPEGEPIGNRGNLPEHVDVRGQGGYVIAPPSVRLGDLDEGGKKGPGAYIWLSGDWTDPAAIAPAPAELVRILRERKKAEPAARKPAAARKAGAAAAIVGDVNDDVRKYALSALDGECRDIGRAPSGRRNEQLNASAFKIATLVAAGALSEAVARSSVEAAARSNPGSDDDRQLIATIDSGWTAGLEQPRDLAEIAAASRARRDRAGPPRPSHASATRPAPAPARPAAPSENREPFRDGRMGGLQSLRPGEQARLKDVTSRWLERRVATCEPNRDAIVRLAFTIGRRVAAGLIGEARAKEALWDLYEDVTDVSHDDVDRALDDGFNRGFDVTPLVLTMNCAGYPLTDFGIAERFRDRFGCDFRFTTTQGWLGWDKRRWKVLDQDEKTPPAEVVSAVFETVRLIQDEGRFVEDTGICVTNGDDELDLTQPHPFGMDRLIPKGKSAETLSSIIRQFGRKSEVADKPNSIARLVRRWLTVAISEFDHDSYAFNVLNGTLWFRRETLPDGKRSAFVELVPHRREDMLTKLSPVEYDPEATSPLYDGMFAWAQPDAGMRAYLHRVGGYSLTGDAGEQKLWFWYGRGRNGKGVTIESWSHVAGDYSGTIPIASLLDQGVKKRGDAASPDLAKLGGVRMLRSSEPGRNEKLDSGLIKLVTGGEPIPVRNLHRGFFDLVPRFKLIISGNTKFDIPDTDDGIWGRLKLIPWNRNILKPEPGVEDWPEIDIHLVDKIKSRENAGVLNHLIRGLLDYMSNGLAEPKSVTQATAAYRDQSDPLARFLRLCVVEESGSRVQSSKLHEVFVAWCKTAGEREWSNKGFSSALIEKGFKKKASDGMQWLDVRLIKAVDDFVDANGHARSMADDDSEDPPPRPAPAYAGDDDLPP